MKLNRIYKSMVKLFPESHRKDYKQKLIYAGDTKGIEFWLGKTLLISLAISFVFILISLALSLNPLVILGVPVGVILITRFVVYILIYFKMDFRTTKVEKALPDALQLIASNLQAGMTPYQAIKVSSRKEFGALAEEFKMATEKALGTKNFAEELLKIGEKFDSGTLKRSLKLITSALSSGGRLATLLEDLSEDIEENQSLKNEMITNTKTYTMFIMFTIIAGAPLLFAISVHFVDMVQDMQGSATLSSDEFGLGFLSGELDITPDFLSKMSLFILSFTSLFATMLTGVITKGKMAAGLKYAPAVILGSIAFFFIARAGIGAFFGS